MGGGSVIIVEGPDGAGKSTLVDYLCTELHLEPGGTHSRRDVELPKNPRPRTYQAIAHAVLGGKVIVHDRLFWSEEVYGLILRGESQFTVTESWRIMNLLRVLKCPVIFVEATWATCEAEVKKNPPQLKGWSVDRANVIWHLYRDAADAAHGKGVNACIYQREPEKVETFRRAQVFDDVEKLGHKLTNYLEERRSIYRGSVR
jgi:hypothetical protein